MAQVSNFKEYRRGVRQATIDSDFSKGMYFTSGIIDEGFVKTLVNYDISDDKKSLVSRPGLRVSQYFGTDILFGDTSRFCSDSVEIYTAKDCIENGHEYMQIILGDYLRKQVYVVTVDKEDPERIHVYPESRLDINSDDIITIFEQSQQFIEDYDANTEEYEAADIFNEFDVEKLKVADDSINYAPCIFDSVKLNKIHDLVINNDVYHHSILGCFGSNNSFYFLSPTGTILQRSVFDAESGCYVFESVSIKSITASEAVTFGYNMLSDEPYSFIDASGGSLVFQTEGILPYDASAADHGKLMMTPKKNQTVWFRLNYNVPSVTSSYRIVWDWKELGSDNWNILYDTADDPNLPGGVIVFTDLPPIEVSFKPPADNILVRVQVYKPNETVVEKAMTVGFDFAVDEHGTVNNLEQKNYDLRDAAGMLSYNNRLVLYGVVEDPTILFISDLNEPTYFPYPNNIIVFDQPIVNVLEFMGNLIVFTTDKVYQVTLAEDGNSWNTVVVQSNLRISPSDKHLILAVRNMLFFKSGDYYYMIVPKATSTTGDLTLAPVSSTVIEFFKEFNNNVTELFEYVYANNNFYELIDYYNFLDYENVHNIYVFSVEDCPGYVHLDCLYHTVDRTWRLYIYQTAHKIFPLQHEATHPGVFAFTNVFEYKSGGSYDRFFQLLEFDNKNAKDFYIPVEYIEDTINEPLETLRTLSLNADDLYEFKNYQFFDTGYRNDMVHINKRFRELQFQINNIDLESLEFGLEFLVDGDKRMTYFRYDTEQVTDVDDRDYGLVYIEPVPIMNIPIDEMNEVLDEIDFRVNHWRLDASLFPEVNLWKVRVPVTGKGAAPRVKFLSCNESRMDIFRLNWIYRTMYMR